MLGERNHDMLHARIERDMSYFGGPFTLEEEQRMDMIRAILKEAAHQVNELVPEGREQSLAFTAIDTAIKESIGGIVRAAYDRVHANGE